MGSVSTEETAMVKHVKVIVENTRTGMLRILLA